MALMDVPVFPHSKAVQKAVPAKMRAAVASMVQSVLSHRSTASDPRPVSRKGSVPLTELIVLPMRSIVIKAKSA